MLALALYMGNNNVLELRGVKNNVTKVVDTGATVTVTIKDDDGVEVAGQAWPASMTHTANGTYQATLDSDLVLTRDKVYIAAITATGSAAEKGYWETPVQARMRQ